MTETATNLVAEYDVSGPVPHLLATLPTAGQPNSVAVDERTGLVYVTGGGEGVLQVVPPI